MIPLRLQYEYTRFPAAIAALVALNAIVFIATVAEHHALVPFLLHCDTFAPWQFLTSMFLHADPLHLGGNMLFLVVFGRYLEERMGPARMLAAYGATGLVAGLAFFLTHLGEKTAALGASGAISGLMGLVMAVGPSVRADVLILVRRIYTTTMPAWVLLGFYVMQDLATAMLVGDRGVAVSAHLGGFGAGFALGVLLRSRGMADSSWYLNPTESDNSEIWLNRQARLAVDIAAAKAEHRQRDAAWRELPVRQSAPVQPAALFEPPVHYDGPLSLVEDLPTPQPPQQPLPRRDKAGPGG